MEFRPWAECRGRPHVLADGTPTDGTVLVLSHWPHSGTPWPLKADLSTEIAFRYLDAPEHHVDVPWVTNDHLDVDGFVAVHALARPEEALARRELLVEVAAAGDFADRCSDRAADIAFAIGAQRDPAASTLPRRSFAGSPAEVAAAHYELLLDGFADLADRIGDFEHLWGPERRTLDEAERALDAGAVRIEDVPEADLAVVWLPDGWPGGGVQRGVLQRDTPVHPMAIHRRTPRWRVAYVDRARRDYRLVSRFESWVQLTSAKAGRADLRPLASDLTALDPSPGDWIANGRKTFLAWLRRRDGSPSGLDAEAFVARCVEHLRSAPISWSPYDPEGPPPAAGRRPLGYAPSSERSSHTGQPVGSPPMAATKPDVSVPGGEPPTDLAIDDLEVGTGPEATAGQAVDVHYVGVSWSSGRQFDASWDRRESFSFRLGAGEVIPGWDRGVAGMKVGGRRRLTIPPDLAYGARGAGGVIGPNETLVFVVDLLGVS
jgi:peptidylprolyl isomerase